MSLKTGNIVLDLTVLRHHYRNFGIKENYLLCMKTSSTNLKVTLI